MLSHLTVKCFVHSHESIRDVLTRLTRVTLQSYLLRLAYQCTCMHGRPQGGGGSRVGSHTWKIQNNSFSMWGGALFSSWGSFPSCEGFFLHVGGIFFSLWESLLGLTPPPPLHDLTKIYAGAKYACRHTCSHVRFINLLLISRITHIKVCYYFTTFP